MKKGLIYTIITAIAFVTFEPVSKLIAGSVSPFGIAFWRFILGALLLCPFAIIKVKKDGMHIKAKDWMMMAGLGVLPEDADHIALKFDATFETKNVGEQNVSLRIVGFEDKGELNLAANYTINSNTTWITRQSILPAPMVIEANVGSKVYDGTDSIDISRIRYTLSGKYPAETDSYSVNVLAGHYVDANVYDEMGNIPEFKTAKLYGIELKNLSTSNDIGEPICISLLGVVFNPSSDISFSS